MISARDRRALVASTALITLLLTSVAACGSPSGSEKPSEGSTPSTSSTAPSTSDSPNTESQTVDANGAALQIPADWLQFEEGKSIVFTPPNDSAGYDTGRTVFSVVDGLREGTPAEIDDLGDDELADAKKGPSVKNARRLPDLEVNGATLFHVQAEDTTEWIDIFGTLNGSERVTVSWKIHKSTGDRKQADAMINPVMATFKFN
jgi:hypothetical protein